jgi:hypothetical protein
LYWIGGNVAVKITRNNRTKNAWGQPYHKKFDITEPIRPPCLWTNDCSGKQNYDGRLLWVSTRYWPDFTAHCSIHLCMAPAQWPEPNDPNHEVEALYNDDYVTVADAYFKGDNKAEVQRAVEEWVAWHQARIKTSLADIYQHPWEDERY